MAAEKEEGHVWQQLMEVLLDARYFTFSYHTPHHHNDTQHNTFIKGVFLCLLRLLMKIQGLQKTNEDILRFYHKRFCCWHLSKFLLLTDIVFISKYVGKLKSNNVLLPRIWLYTSVSPQFPDFRRVFVRRWNQWCRTLLLHHSHFSEIQMKMRRNTVELLAEIQGEGHICLYWDKAHFLHYG